MSTCCSQQCAVATRVDRALHLTAEDSHLVAQHEVLEANLPGGTLLEGEHAE
jgi:hypothetical protein